MAELIDKLGINLGLLIAQIVNFSIIVLVLWKFGYKPVVSMLEKRRIRIEKSIAEAEKIEKERGELDSEYKRRIAEARTKSDTIVTDAKKQADDAKAEIAKQAEVESKKILEAAEREIVSSRDAAKKEIEEQAAKLVAEAVTRISREEIDATKNEALIKKTLKEIS